MTQILTKTQFLNLDLDDKCILLEALMTDAYFSGQQEIGFWFPEDYTGEDVQATLDRSLNVVRCFLFIQNVKD